MDSAGYIAYLVEILLASTIVLCENVPVIDKVSVLSKNGNILAIQIEGANLAPAPKIRTSTSTTECEGPDAVLQSSFWFPNSSVGYIKVINRQNSDLYLCLRTFKYSEEWKHQGQRVVIPSSSG